MKNYRPLVAPQLEAGVRIMIYAGVGEFTVSAAVVKSSACSQSADSVDCAADDWICNWMGNHKWLSEMKWSQQADFLSAPERNFTVNSAVAGSVQAHGPLSFVKIYNAVCAHHQLTGLLAAHPFVLLGLGALCSGREKESMQVRQAPHCWVGVQGHMVPMDQGKHALAMLRSFLRNESLTTAAAKLPPTRAVS